MRERSAAEFLATLPALDVVLSVHEGRLRCNGPEDVLTPEFRAELARHKPALLELLQNVSADGSSAADRMRRVSRGGPLPLSFAQQRLWLLAEMQGAGEAYHVPLVLQMRGALEEAALRRALDRVIARHEVLRTTFALSGGEPVQRIAAVEASHFQLRTHDLRDSRDGKAELDRLIARELAAPFDLTTGPLIRGRLMQLAAGEWVLAITMHHIVSDGWSVPLLIKELKTLYAAYLQGRPDPLPELEVQYADYSVWLREWMTGDLQKQQADYWKEALAGTSGILEIPADHPRPALQNYAGAAEPLKLDADLTARIKEFSRRHQVTLFMTLAAAWALLLSRLCGQADVVIGTPVANRRQKQVEELIGFFVNTLALRFDFSGSPTVRDLLEQTKTRSLAALRNQEIPFEQIVEIVNPVRSAAYSPLVQVMFAWQNNIPEALDFAGLEVQVYPNVRNTAKFDLLLDLQEEGDSIAGVLEYATALFEPSTIQRYLGYYRRLLEGMVADDSQAVDSLPMLSEAEQHVLVVENNRTEMEYPREVPLATLVEQQVARTPEATAVIFGSESMTYRELNERANQLARELVKHGAGPEQLVGIFAERSLSMMVGFLAVVKTGAGYLPLDPHLPAARLQYMIEECGVRLMVTQDGLLPALPKFAGKAVLLGDRSWQANSSDNLNVAVMPEHRAYVIYTSGSTGRPKGVEILYGGLINALWALRACWNFGATDRLLAVSTISFDISGVDIWVPWLVGATTVLASREAAADAAQLQSLLQKHDITFLQATAVTWRLLLGMGWKGKPNLQIGCTGEAMPREFAVKLQPRVAALWNLYGPTETTIWCTAHRVQTGEAPIVIGRPLGNQQCYILNEQRQLAPIGAVGELYIGGAGLGRGYCNRPDLTREAFVPNPFSSEPGARMYRTGDLARYLADGNIECLGRTDHQVKIRGHRVELGEIEALLTEHPDIAAAVVTAPEERSGERHLVAYYTRSSGPGARTALNAKALREHLLARLPEYMVPVAFVAMESLPLTSSGKVDRKLLPQPDGEARVVSEYEPPRDELERQIAAIWAELLGVNRVGRNDNFFEIGGHSLLAVQLILNLKGVLEGESLPLNALLDCPTVKGLAARIRDRHRNGSHPVLVAVRSGSASKTPFFCVHAADGTAMGMRALAMRMDPGRTFYCLQAKGLDGSALFTSVEEAARFYLEEVKKAQPHGPYLLGGYCFGGIVAFEMARLLAQAGEQVESLILMDSMNPVYVQSSPPGEMLRRLLSFYLRRARLHLRTVGSLDPRARTRYVMGRGRAVLVHFRHYVKRVKGQGTNAAPDAINLPAPEPTSEARLDKILARLKKLGPMLARKYTPRPYQGDALVIRVNERNDDPFEDYFLGWRPLIRGNLKSVEIQSSHEGILREPAVRPLAEVIDGELESCELAREQTLVCAQRD